MITACALPTMYSRGFQLDEGEDAIGLLESRCVAHDSPVHLQEAMAEDGYLFLHECLESEEVLAARRHILTQLSAEGQLDPAAPLMMGKTEARYQSVFPAGISAEKQSAAAASSVRSAGKSDELFLVLPRGRGSAFRFHLVAMHITGPGHSQPLRHCLHGSRYASSLHRVGSAGRYRFPDGRANGAGKQP